MSDEDHEIIVAMRRDRKTIRQISDRLKVPEYTVRRAIRKLESEGLVDTRQQAVKVHDSAADDRRIAVYEAVQRDPETFGARTAVNIARETKLSIEAVKAALAELSATYCGTRLIEPVKGHDCAVTWQPLYKSRLDMQDDDGRQASHRGVTLGKKKSRMHKGE